MRHTLWTRGIRWVFAASFLAAPTSLGAEDPARQFDFLIGAWQMDLTEVLDDGTYVEREPSYSLVTSEIGGNALLDRWSSDGFTVRTYDPRAKVWRLFWTDRGHSQGRIQYWEGTFDGDQATFIGGDSFPNPRGRISSKIIFSGITEDSCDWEIYLSRDGGKTWRLDWIREYTKIEIDEDDERFAWTRQTQRHAEGFDWLLGSWNMNYTQVKANGQRKFIGDQPSTVRPLIGGRALFDDWNGYGFTIRTFDPRAKKWRFFWTDRGPSQGKMSVWEGAIEGDSGVFLGGYSMPNSKPGPYSKIVFSDITEDSCHWEMFKAGQGEEKWILTDIRKYTRRK